MYIAYSYQILGLYFNCFRLACRTRVQIQFWAEPISHCLHVTIVLLWVRPLCVCAQAMPQILHTGHPQPIGPLLNLWRLLSGSIDPFKRGRSTKPIPAGTAVRDVPGWDWCFAWRKPFENVGASCWGCPWKWSNMIKMVVFTEGLAHCLAYQLARTAWNSHLRPKARFSGGI